MVNLPEHFPRSCAMDLTTGFLLYAAAFRLAIIGAGVVSIVLGYKLFVQGVIRGGRTDAEAQLGDIRLSVRNAAPGTCFALFGVVIIVIMFIQGSPELTLRTAGDAVNIEKGAITETAAQASRHLWQEIGLKGGDSVADAKITKEFEERLHKAAVLLRKGQEQRALEAYSKSLEVPGLSTSQAAISLNQLTRLYLARDQIEIAYTLATLAVLFDPTVADYHDALARVLIKGRKPEAVGSARIAVDSDPGNASYLHTIALSLEAAGNLEEAMQAMTEAVALDEVYADELERLEARAK
jgi:tetratricopeptide (TPR) repeat protein